MAISRNRILLSFLLLFLLWYAVTWAYQTQYVAPRRAMQSEADRLSSEMESNQNYLNAMNLFYEQTYRLYLRSLPPVPNDAQALYSFWLLELLQYSGLADNQIDTGSFSRIEPGAEYRFSIQTTGSLAQITQFLFEFYSAPFLHRISSLTLTPTAGSSERLTCAMTVNVLALNSQFNPFRGTSLEHNRVPDFHILRLSSHDPADYQVIADRNLLHETPGGIDRADFTFLTGLPRINGEQEVWFSIRTDNSLIKAKLGDTIRSGSFVGKIIAVYDQDIILDRAGSQWLLELGESLNEAFALPIETTIN